MLQQTITTKFLIVSNTYGLNPTDYGEFRQPLPTAHVLIHAGNMTTITNAQDPLPLALETFKSQIKWMVQAEIELKILVAGKHDIIWTGDGEEDEKIWKYLNSEELKESGICLLNEQSKQFHLRNGAIFSVQALTIDDKPVPPFLSGLGKDIHEGPTIVISQCPTSLCYNEPLDCKILLKYLSITQPRLNIYHHKPITWGAQTVTWPLSKNSGLYEAPFNRKPILAKELIREDEDTGEKFLDLQVFGKGLLKNQTMMINAEISQERQEGEEKVVAYERAEETSDINQVRPVMLVNLECEYKEIVEFVGMGLMESSTRWGKWKN